MMAKNKMKEQEEQGSEEPKEGSDTRQGQGHETTQHVKGVLGRRVPAVLVKKMMDKIQRRLMKDEWMKGKMRTRKS